ncbi:MAG: sialate O-acetylesterase [Clostridia bacterium]
MKVFSKIFKNDWVRKFLVFILIEIILLGILVGGYIYLKWKMKKDIVPHGFEVDAVFSDNMVFQQNEKIRIWGTSECEGETITAVFDGSYGQSVVEGGKWEIELSERSYITTPTVMEIYGAGEYLALENVKVGDVWWVIGQSNVEFTVSADPEGESFLSSLTGNENITFCKMEMDSYDKNNVRWKNISRYSASDFSALGTYFANELNSALQGEVPVGIVSFGFSGCELSRFLPKGEEYGRRFDGPIYDNVIKNMLKMPIRGLLWYQGEADSNDYSRYSARFASFIDYLREEKDMCGEMPVYVVELSPCFNDETDPDRQFIDFGIVRGEICSVATMVDDLYICPTSDLWSDRGYSNNLHPTNKLAIARRLSLMVLSGEYGYGYRELYFPPTLTKVEKVSDKEILLHFDYVQGTLNCPDITEIILIDDNWNLIEDASVTVEEDKIRIESTTPVCIIRYNCNVENVFGEQVHLSDDVLPATAFAIKIKEPEITSKKSGFGGIGKCIVFICTGAAILIAILLLKKCLKKGDK